VSARRKFFARAGSLALPLLLPRFARAQSAQVGQENPIAPLNPLDPMIYVVTKGATIRKGKVTVDLPPLADNGNSVALRLTVDSPMTKEDYVKAIHLFSEKNPVRNMAVFYLGPRAGRAEILSRIRLAGSQQVVAIAELSDGSFWSGSAGVVVTLSACLDES
jgi:sulfur-oxidizing protein SoxY